MELVSGEIRVNLPLYSTEIDQERANIQHDYRRLPRSSGDGMESRKSSTDADHLTAKNKRKTENTLSDWSVSQDVTALQLNVTKKEKSGIPLPSSEPSNQRIDNTTGSHQVPPTGYQYSESDISACGVNSNSCIGTLGPENSALGTKSVSLERKPECLDLQSLIKDLEDRNKNLTDEKEKLLNKLSVQSKVNADLKKLLVASVGEDIGSRLEQMVVDKAQFDTTLTNLESQIEQATEELNRVSIECDVWRTKFLASRMMTNGLTDMKTTLFLKHRNCQTALQKLLEEQSDIRQHLRATNRLLQGVYRVNHSSKKITWEKTFERSSIIELAHVNYNLAEDICYRINPSHYYATVNNSSEEDEIIPLADLTPAEQMACQVLKTDADYPTDVNVAMQRMGKQYIGNSYASRFLTNNFRVTFDCCDRCTGALKVV